MSHALAADNKKIIRRLLRTGRWNNEMEIIRYGITLVDREVRRDGVCDLPEPLEAGTLAKCYRRQTATERREEQALLRASVRIKPESF